MRLLGFNDKKNYNDNDTLINRMSARAIIIKDNKIYVSYQKNNDLYKLPGGGVEDDESILDALIRETKEEVGLIIKEDSIKVYGHFIDKWASEKENEKNKIWHNTSYYYICDVLDEKLEISPTESEIKAGATVKLMDIDEVIKVNENYIMNHPNELFAKREKIIFELIKEELL